MTISVDNARMPRKRIAVWTVAALLALNAVLLAEGAGMALPGSLGQLLLRAEARARGGARQGRRRPARLSHRPRRHPRRRPNGTLSLLERDGSLVAIPVAPTAAITIGGQPASFSALRRGMVATVIRDGDAPATEVRATRQ